MKQLLLICLLAFFVACQNDKTEKQANEEPNAEAGPFDWLLGNWHRTNEQEGKETFETWKKKTNTAYLGLGYTMQATDTTWRESIKLIQTGDVWNFEVTGRGDSEPTVFQLTEIGKQQFTCENELHDFPKKIEYIRNGNEINAMIFGDDKQIAFDFERIGEE